MKLLTVAALTGGALAQSGAWGQCGGQGWSGATTCVAGYTCVVSNPWYSQCLPGSAPPPPASTTTTSSARPITTSSATTLQTSTRVATSSSGSSPTSVPGAFEWYGVNESGGEFGEDYLPGQWGKHFTFPNPAAVSTLRRDGYNTFRVQFKMERLSQSTLTGSFDAAYLRNLTDSVNQITNSGGIAVLDPHNYGRYFGNIITSTSDFRTWWRNVATQFASNPRVVFDTNNEYHTMDQNLVLQLNQAAIDGIRAAGAQQTIFVEGNQWSGAWSWPDVNDNMKNLVDPLNRIVYQMHQYLDSDSSGTSPNCVSGTIGRERLIAATNWLRANNKVGILGEFAGGANPTCRTALTGLLDHLAANKDVWRGFLWWAAGPWWSDYMYSFEPPTGTGYVNYNSLLKQYIP